MTEPGAEQPRRGRLFYGRLSGTVCWMPILIALNQLQEITVGDGKPDLVQKSER
jgi:hypothetical protein